MDAWQVYDWSQGTDLSTRVRRLERGRQYLRGGSLVDASGSYSAIPSTILDGNNIDLASGSVLAQGSIPPSMLTGNFAYTATTTSLTIYWDGTNSSAVLSLLRASGEVVHIPGGSLTVSGLTANTTYGFLPYWSPFNNCGIGWIVGDSGSPQFAFTAAAQTATAIQQQMLQGREPLTAGFITFPTPAAGTGGGTGTGKYCVMLGTDIEPLGDNTYSTQHFPQNEWIRIECDGFPKSLNCTPNHPLFSPDKGKMNAELFNPGNWIVTDQGEHKVSEVRRMLRVCTKVHVTMPNGHLFFANGYLSHNAKVYNP